MSTTIDNKVVQMEFDNSRFERNVQTSISTIEKLKQSLNLTGAAKGFENVNAAAKGVNLSGLASAAETVTAKFSYMQMTIQHQLNRIVDGAVNAGRRIVSALTIAPVKTGFQEYETQINAVQTILANTESKGTTLNDVNSALDTLNEYADKTIYNFTQMTRNIGTFTAAGVDLDTSVSAIQGIANLAAVSGSTSQQASTAMYQLSQALAAGRVSLMDWNSVVNAGMGGQVFQDALKRTSEVMGTGAEAAIKKYGSFRESLTQGEWLTTEVLTETLKQFTMATDLATEEGKKKWKEYKKSLMDDGYTEKQAEEILKMANTATNAATKVKTFTQLWDTLQEAAQSGWTQTWEILVGDFEEAKEMLTKISDTINEIIGNSAKVRNELLQGWKDKGGRDDLLAGFANIWESIVNIATPIKNAFRDIFPPLTVKQLTSFTEGFKNLTEHFKVFTEKYGDQIYSSFKGIFSVIDIGWNIVKQLASGIVELIGHFTGLGGGVLSATGSIGDWLTNLRDTVKETDIFGTAIDKIVGFLGKAIDVLKNFGKSVKESFKSPEFEGFVGILEGMWNIVKKIGSGVVQALAPIGRSISSLFDNANLFDVLNTGLLAGSFVGIKNLAGGFSEIFESITGDEGIFTNIKGILDDVRGCFEAYQNNLKAETLGKIATAIAILAGSLFVISSIDAEALDRSVAAMALLFAELMGSMAVFTKIDAGTFKGVAKMVPMMIGASIAIAILSVALKNISSIGWEEINIGLTSIGILLAEIGAFLNFYKFDGKLTGAAFGIVLLSGAMLVLSKAVENFGSMSWDAISKGLISIGLLLGTVSLFVNSTGNAKHVMATGASMILLGAAMKIFASALKDFGGMKWEEINNGLAGMGLVLAELTLALNLMPNNMVGKGVGLIAVGAAMAILAKSLSSFGGMSWDDISKGLIAMGLSLGTLALALNAMNGTAAGSAALIIAAGALAIIAPVMKILGGMSWDGIWKGLVSLAGAFTIIGVAGLVLAPIIPTILGLAGAFALFGIATLGIGAGLALIGVGITALATALTASATSIVASLTVIIMGLVDLIPALIGKFGEIISSLCTVIVECAPQIADTVLVVLAEVLNSLATYTPQIVDSLLTFLIGVLDGLAERMPELIQSAVNLIGSFFQGVVDALSGIDTSSLLKGVVGVGLMSGMMIALSAVAGLVPGAMVGVLGMGAVIAELALVLAAIGALAQIPGLSWLIGEGGDLLQSIGTAIGQFVGGIVGGIAEGATSTLPQVGTNLSTFMTNLQPFLDGISSVDASVISNIGTLASALLTLTGASLLESITSWLTGGSSLSDFASQLVPFGTAMKQFAAEVSGIDVAAISTSVLAAESLVAVAKAIPSDGAFGTDGIDDFGKNVVAFGKSMKKYGEEVVDINITAMTASVSAAKSLVSIAKAIPDDGAFGTDGIDDFGKNVVTFGKALKNYSEKVADVDSSAITSSVTAAKKLISLINNMSGINTSGVDTFKSAINSLAKTNLDGFVKAFSTSTAKVASAGASLVDALSKGITAKASSLTTTANTMVNAMQLAIRSKANVFGTSGVALMQEFIKGVSAQNPKVATAVRTSVNTGAMSIRASYTSFYSAGSYLVSGFANGISANTWKATAKARAMANAAERAAKAALDEHSPSRVFYQIGDYAGQGFVNALDDNVDKAYSASYGMADSAKSGLAKALSKIGETVSNDIDTQPTIRPILDLSDVSSGVNAMNNMFGVNPSVGALANIGRVGLMMNGYGQNGSLDVVSAINKLGKSLANGGGNTYIVDGVTYDDGSNVTNAVKDIIRYTRIEGRA